VQQQQQVQQPQAVAGGQGQAPVVAGTYANTLAFAQANIGRRVGNGGCNDLGAGGAQIGTVSAGGAVTGNIVPGAIFEMRNFSISSTDGATWTSPLNLHYGVVESYDPATRTATILHQNTQGGRAGGQFVTRTAFRLDTLTRGSIIVKAGN
jgi:phospholipase/lecithinase/hemolysin